MTESWKSAGLCRTYPDLPWIADPEGVTSVDIARMAIVCAACPVVFECGDYAACERITSGFWAGRDRTPATAVDGAA